VPAAQARAAEQADPDQRVGMMRLDHQEPGDGDLLAALRAWVRAVTRTPMGRVLIGLIAEAQHDSSLAEAWRRQVIEPMRAQRTVMIERAIARGEIPASTDADIVLDLLYGASYHRLLHGHRPLTDAFARETVDLIIAGLGAGAAPTPR
jgi:predicted nucleotidyltransferase